MKPRTEGFLRKELISHESEHFDYIAELHEYLWRFVRVSTPGAGGRLEDYLDHTIENLEEKKNQTKI